MVGKLTPDEERQLHLASVALFTNDGSQPKPKEPTPEPPTTKYTYAIDKLKDGTLTWKEYLPSLSPEELEALRRREREKAKKRYQEKKERRKQYNKAYLAHKKGYVLYDEDL